MYIQSNTFEYTVYIHLNTMSTHNHNTQCTYIKYTMYIHSNTHCIRNPHINIVLIKQYITQEGVLYHHYCHNSDAVRTGVLESNI